MDPAYGSTLEEVTLEKALNCANELRETEEVTRTMQALKLGKLFMRPSLLNLIQVVICN